METNTEVIRYRKQPFSLVDYITSSSELTIRSETSRLLLYEEWLDRTGRHLILNPDLVAYRQYLESTAREAHGYKQLKASSIAAHIRSIRSRYVEMIERQPARLRDFFYSQTPAGTSPADAKAYVDEQIIRLLAVIKNRNANVTEHVLKDVEDERLRRLTQRQVETLLQRMDDETRLQKRDRALLAILFATGIREMELVNLDVADLRTHLQGHLALRVRHGKGAKQRLVVYGDFERYLVYVDTWLASAGIAQGAVFRGMTRWDTIRSTRLSVRAVNDILARYTQLKPHDCRRTYAKICRSLGMSIEAIADNLGHEDIKTTMRYIGESDVDSRVPKFN